MPDVCSIASGTDTCHDNTMNIMYCTIRTTNREGDEVHFLGRVVKMNRMTVTVDRLTISPEYGLESSGPESYDWSCVVAAGEETSSMVPADRLFDSEAS